MPRRSRRRIWPQRTAPASASAGCCRATAAASPQTRTSRSDPRWRTSSRWLYATPETTAAARLPGTRFKTVPYAEAGWAASRAGDLLRSVNSAATASAGAACCWSACTDCPGRQPISGRRASDFQHGRSTVLTAAAAARGPAPRARLAGGIGDWSAKPRLPNAGRHDRDERQKPGGRLGPRMPLKLFSEPWEPSPPSVLLRDMSEVQFRAGGCFPGFAAG